MKTNYSIYKTFVVISLLISCKSELQKNNSIEGVWESIGYGRIFQIDSTTYSIYDITKMSCLPIGVGSSSDFDGVISFKSDTLSIKRGYSVYSYTRIEDLPELCKRD